MRTRTPGRVAWGMKFFTALHSPALGLLFGLGSALTCQAEDPTYYRGNTHTHSLWSDGNDFPEMIVDWYQQQGYDFIALSDHNILAEGDKWMAVEAVKSRQKVPGAGAMEKYRARFGETWVKTREKDGKTEVRLSTLEEYRGRFEKPGEFLIVPAEEISSTWRTASAPKGLPVHINVVNVKEVIKPAIRPTAVETMRAVLLSVLEQERVTGQPMLAHLNHPNFQWAITAEEIAQVVEERFVEIYNGHPGVHHLGDATRPGQEKIWDIANTIRLRDLHAAPLWGVATDDSHNYHGGEVSPGRGWVMVRAAALEAGALVTAMKAGDFYASSGVTLREIRFDPSTRRLSVSLVVEPGATYRCELIGTRRAADSPVGEVFASKTGASVDFDLPEDALYGRITITASVPHGNPSFEGQKKQAWTQPVGWEQTR
ncbi:MAG: PHP domain-containing protein [Verrucomicrobiales bacterium]|nr:hypothetical protein [Verrucomicrobiae bacterium]MCP5553950.1 hypothetical protein [Akkermansiaceae bacterium]